MALTTLLPQPPDYLGTLWALAGVRGVRVICHGTSGCTFYDFVGFRDVDPTRWPGPVFTTGLDESDIVTGGDAHLAEAVMEVDRRHRPGLIALVNTSVAALTGADPHALARQLQPQVRARLLAFSGGGMRGLYTQGAAEALAALAREWVEGPSDAPAGAPTVNLIGPTYETFNAASDTAEVQRLLALLGVRVRVITSDTDLESLGAAGAAHLNLVLRDVGLPAAQVLEQRCGTPYLYGAPFGAEGTREWLSRVAERLGLEGSSPQVEADARRYHTRFATVSPWHGDGRPLRIAVAAPYDYALGLTRVLAEDWHLHVALAVLPVAPLAPGAEAALRGAGAAQVLIEPPEAELAAAFQGAAPHILLGSAEDSRLAPGVPVHIRVARPSFDCAAFHDGTPFMGHRGLRWLAQSLVNAMYAARFRL